MNRRKIVYVGSQDAVAVYDDRRREYSFPARKPVAVPDDFAKKLCQSPDFILEEELHRTLQEKFPKGGTFQARRWGAMGDLLMLRATIASFTRRHPEFKFGLRCQSQFGSWFESDPLWAWVKVVGQDVPEVDGSILFDMVAEQDHRGAPQDRMELFHMQLTREPLELLPEDWVTTVPAPISEYVGGSLQRARLLRPQRVKPLVGVQVRGSGLMKSLPREQVRALTTRLLTTCSIALIEGDPSQVWEEKGIFTMTQRDALHGIELLRHCDLMICFDSGPLWLAHAAPCPVLCIMGPTRPEQRLMRHPLIGVPGKVEAFRLNEYEGIETRVKLPQMQKVCPPCFEQAKACNGTYACMQKNPPGVVEAIAAKAEGMLRAYGVLN